MNNRTIVMVFIIGFLFFESNLFFKNGEGVVKAASENIDIVELDQNMSILESNTLNVVLTGISPPVNWVSSDNSVVIIESQEGTTVNITAKGAGTAYITASVNGGYSDFIKVTVSIPVNKITLNTTSLNLTVRPDGTGSKTLRVNFDPTNATNQEVSWSSDDPYIATVDSDGKVIPIKEGTTKITAKSGNSEASCNVFVKENPVTSISLDNPPQIMIKGIAQTLRPIVKPDNASNTQVKWKSTNPSVASVDDNGVVHPIKAGTTTIIATTVVGGYSATSTITVRDSSSTSITLNKTSTTLYAGRTSESLTATVNPSNAANKTITWTSSNSSVATVGSTTGVVSPISTGTATITATNGESIATCTVTVLSSSSGLARNFHIDRVTDSMVELNWTGTSGSVYVELRKESNNSYVTSSNTSNREVTFYNLSADTEYIVLVDGYEIGNFTTRDEDDDDDIDDLEVERRSSSSVEITWRGTSGYVDVELRRSNGSTVDSESTNDRSVIFSGLSEETVYRIYIDDEYMESFTIEDLDDNNSNGDIEDFDITDIGTSTVTAEWDSDETYEDVEIRRNGRVIDSEWTNDDEVRFTGLSPDTTYSIYIEDDFMDSFTTDDEDNRNYYDNRDYNDEIDEENNVRNFQVIKKHRTKSVEITWSGTSGAVSASLRQRGVSVDSKRTSDRRAVFTNIRPNEDYTVYIDNQLMGNFNMGIFSDIENHWAKAAIERLNQYKIISGFDDGSIRADKTLTREEFITMLVHGLKYPTQNKKSIFGDVPQSRWSSPYISAAVEKGVIVPSEYYRSLFQPTKGITREEMAVMTARAMKLKANASPVTFSDHSRIVNKGLVGALVEKKVISGYPDNTFQPKKILTRAEGIMVIDKIYKP